MSFELISKVDKSTFSFTGSGWTFCLILSEQYGWECEGTTHPLVIDGWHGRYDSPEEQVVSQNDALNLGKAVECALTSDSLENNCRKVADFIDEEVKKALGEISDAARIKISINEEFLEYYKSFSEFCSKGEFSIT